MTKTGAGKKREQRVILILATAVVVLAALNTSRFFTRLDLSRNAMYSISRVSRRIAQELPEQVSITYYVSEKLGARYPFPAQIEDMLGEYASYGRGKIVVSIVDPARSKKPLQLESLGIVGQQMQVVERQELNVATVYSGIVIQYLDRVQAIPFVSDVSTLEYDITSRIRSLMTGTTKGVGILIGNSQKSVERDYRSLVQDLQADFQPQPVQPGEDIPPELSTLIVIGNKDLDSYALFPIDQFIMRGGKVLFAVDGVDVDLAQGLRATKLEGNPLLDMLASYGVRVKNELVLDSLNQRIPFRVTSNQVMVVSYPEWITISNRSVSHTNPVTSRFSGLDLYWPSPLEVAGRQGVTVDTLVSSSPDAWLMKDNFQTNPALAQTPMMLDSGPRGQYTLAATVSGVFKSYFAGKDFPARPGEKQRWTTKVEQSPETRMIVVGDADFPSDMVQYTQASYNMAFVSNCVDWLGKEDDLLSIKTRTQTDVRLNRIVDPALKARVMLAGQVVNVVIVPLLVVGFGVFRLLMRQRRKREAR